MTEIVGKILDFVREITFLDVLALWVKLIILCFVYAFVCEGIDVMKRFVRYYITAKYNFYTTKVQKRIEERLVVPYVKNDVQPSKTIDISSMIETTPKIVAKINIMTGRIETKEVWKKRGICEKFIHPIYQGMAKSKIAISQTEEVEKDFVYAQTLINTLNWHYPNWQETNANLANALQNERIVAEEVIIPYLQNFRK